MSSSIPAHFRDFRSLVGIVAATPTALTADQKIDRASAAALAKHLVASGVAGIAPLGGTGECVALSPQQRAEMLEVTIEAVNGAVPVIAGVGSPGLGDTLLAGKDALAAGAAGLMVITPYFQRPTQEGIVDYYKAISDKLDADIVLYELPFRTGVSLTAETVDRLADQTRVRAMKACNLDVNQFMGIVAAAGEKISVLSGDEDIMPVHVGLGAKGALLASGTLFPRIWAEILRLGRSNQLDKAVALHRELKPALDALFAEHNPAPIKATLAMLGRSAGEVISPLRPASPALRERLSKVIPSVMLIEEELGKAPQLKSA